MMILRVELELKIVTFAKRPLFKYYQCYFGGGVINATKSQDKTSLRYCLVFKEYGQTEEDSWQRLFWKGGGWNWRWWTVRLGRCGVVMGCALIQKSDIYGID